MKQTQLEAILDQINDESPDILLIGEDLEVGNAGVEREKVQTNVTTQTNEVQPKEAMTNSTQTKVIPSEETKIVLNISPSSQILAKSSEVLDEALMCEECGNLFGDKITLRNHLNFEHSKQQDSALTSDKTTHKCEDCGFRTQMAADLFHHTIYEHNPDEATGIFKKIKPVDPAVIYLLAEQNLALGEEVKKLRTHVKRLMEKPKSDTSVMCNKCQDTLTYPTRLQEHLRKEHSCMTCKKSFKTEKEKKFQKIVYPCSKCKKSYHTMEGLKNHQETIHTDIKDDLKCTECPFTDNNENSVVKHMEYSHPEMFSPHKVQDLAPTMKQLKCFKCDQHENTED